MLLLEEERLRLIEEKELVRLIEAERKAFLVDQRRGHDAEVKELVAQSENQLKQRRPRRNRMRGMRNFVRRQIKRDNKKLGHARNIAAHGLPKVKRIAKDANVGMRRDGEN